MVAMVTCLTPMSARVETSFSNSLWLSLMVGMMGSILAVAAMSCSMVFCSADILFSGGGAWGSMRAAVSSCRVVMVVETTVGVFLKMGRSLVTRSDLVTMRRGNLCLARICAHFRVILCCFSRGW